MVMSVGFDNLNPQGLMGTSVTKGGTVKLPKKFEIVENILT
jgi:hypothetical protein